MKNTLPDLEEFSKEINKMNFNEVGVSLGLAPMFPLLMSAKTSLPFSIYAQNVSEREEGAFTGEVSAKLLKSINVDGAIVGHSERRTYFLEQDALIAKKIKLLRQNGLRAIFCVGETLEQYQNGETLSVVSNQLIKGLSEVEKDDMQNIIIAYEPVWAIGTGLVCPLEEASAICREIKLLVGAHFSLPAEQIVVLYGGSVDPNNVKALLGNEYIDGVLVGGASVKAASFKALIEA